MRLCSASGKPRESFSLIYFSPYIYVHQLELLSEEPTWWIFTSGIWISLGCRRSTTRRATADRPWLEATMACSTQVHLNQTLTITGRLD
jgi:hypothetical protein